MTDKERLDFLQKLTDDAQYTGRVLLRMSGTGRGWRLHETEIPGATVDVREAIDQFITENPDVVERAKIRFPDYTYRGPPAEAVPIPNYVGPPAEAVPIPNYVPPQEPYCMHDNCPECNGTGQKTDGRGSCVHMISCLCPKCSPMC